MVTYRTATEIAAPAQRIWNLLANIDAWPAWMPTVRSVEVLDGMPPKVGHRYLVAQRRLRPALWTVRQVDPGRRLLWRARKPGTRMTADRVVESLAPQRSRVTLHFTFDGVLARVAGALFGRIADSYLRQEARALKRRAEGAR